MIHHASGLPGFPAAQENAGLSPSVPGLAMPTLTRAWACGGSQLTRPGGETQDAGTSSGLRVALHDHDDAAHHTGNGAYSNQHGCDRNRQRGNAEAGSQRDLQQVGAVVGSPAPHCRSTTRASARLQVLFGGE